MNELKQFLIQEGIKKHDAYELTSDVIENNLEYISGLDVFKNLKVGVTHHPFIKVGDKVLNRESKILKDGDVLSENLILNKIELIPFGKVDSLRKPVKDGATVIQNVVTPNYDIVTYICLTINVEKTKEETLREDLHSLLDKILDNPREYAAATNMELKLYGFFGDNVINDN